MTTRPVPGDPETWVAWAWATRREPRLGAVLVGTGSSWWWTTPLTPARYMLAGPVLALPPRRRRYDRAAWERLLAPAGWAPEETTTDARSRAVECVRAVPSASAAPRRWRPV